MDKLKTILKPSLVLYVDPSKDGTTFRSSDAYGRLCTVTDTTWNLKGRTFAGAGHISIPTFVDTGSSKEITVLVWAKGASQTKSIFNHADYGIDLEGWEMDGSAVAGLWKVHVFDDGTGDVGHKKNYQSSIVLLDNTFHLMGFTFNNGTLKIYADGMVDPNPTKTSDDAFTTLFNSTSAVEIGCILNSGVPANLFTGTIGECFIYNSCLNSGEIFDIYSATKGFYK